METSQREKTCCFTGHRYLPPEPSLPLQSAIKSAVKCLISKGVIYYGVGGAIGFDTLAAETLFELRKEFPQIRVILVYLFEGFYLQWSLNQQKKFQILLPQYDKIVCISNTPCREAFLARNRHLINHSTYCIAYCNRNNGGTAYTLQYAQDKKCNIKNLSPIVKT